MYLESMDNRRKSPDEKDISEVILQRGFPMVPLQEDSCMECELQGRLGVGTVS
jgi:hypothetical protein